MRSKAGRVQKWPQTWPSGAPTVDPPVPSILPSAVSQSQSSPSGLGHQAAPRGARGRRLWRGLCLRERARAPFCCGLFVRCPLCRSCRRRRRRYRSAAVPHKQPELGAQPEPEFPPRLRDLLMLLRSPPGGSRFSTTWEAPPLSIRVLAPPAPGAGSPPHLRFLRPAGLSYRPLPGA